MAATSAKIWPQQFNQSQSQPDEKTVLPTITKCGGVRFKSVAVKAKQFAAFGAIPIFLGLLTILRQIMAAWINVMLGIAVVLNKALKLRMKIIP